jgi:hypothetical protein
MAASFGEKAFAWTIYWQLTIINSYVTFRYQSEFQELRATVPRLRENTLLVLGSVL